MAPCILCINPWIYDFAAYDHWAKPLGLLYIAAWLRERGMHVEFIDCLDKWHPELLRRQHRATPKLRRYGIGHFHREMEYHQANPAYCASSCKQLFQNEEHIPR